MPTTLRAILEKLQEDTYKCDPNDIDTALTAIQKWAEGKVPAKKKFKDYCPCKKGNCSGETLGYAMAIDETLANIRRRE